jgi:putative ABC transport system permease protein
MFVEMGFMHGVYDSATVLLTKFDAELLIVNPLKENLFSLTPFPRARLAQARGQVGVAGVHPVYMALDIPWKNSRNGRLHPIRVIGIDPEDPIWSDPEIQRRAQVLTRPETCLLDSDSRDYFGDLARGARAELNGTRIEVVGTVPIGPDLTIDGTVVTSDVSFFDSLQESPERVELGLVQLARDADPEAVAEALRLRLPDDVRVIPRMEFIDLVHAYWREHQPAGTVFVVGMIVGFMIGCMICYQILFTEIADHQSQYATLKAIGYHVRFLVGTVLRQALYLALTAFFAGALGSVVAYHVLRALTGFQMWITPGRVLIVMLLTVTMCVVSAAIAIRKVLASDPAEVF